MVVSLKSQLMLFRRDCVWECKGHLQHGVAWAMFNIEYQPAALWRQIIYESRGQEEAAAVSAGMKRSLGAVMVLLMPALVAGFCEPGPALTGTSLRHAVQRHRRRAPLVPSSGALRLTASATQDPDVFVKKSEVLATLSMVEDPSRGRSVTSLGAVKDLLIDKDTGAVVFNLELGAPDLKGAVKKQSEETVGTLPWVTSVTVTMIAMSPLDETREASAASATGLTGVKNVVLCASCKGGVGKSTTSGVCVRDRIFKELPRQVFSHNLLDCTRQAACMYMYWNMQFDMYTYTHVCSAYVYAYVSACRLGVIRRV